MKIRPAKSCDLEELLDIFNYEILHGTASFSTHEKTLEERSVWFKEHNRENHPLIVAEEDGKVAGYASLSEFRSNEAYRKSVELSVYVDHNCCGRGIGAALMSAILEMARADENIHSVVSVITAGNDGSIELHKKFGFEYCGRLREIGEKFGIWLDTENYQLLV